MPEMTNVLQNSLFESRIAYVMIWLFTEMLCGRIARHRTALKWYQFRGRGRGPRHRFMEAFNPREYLYHMSRYDHSAYYGLLCAYLVISENIIFTPLSIIDGVRQKFKICKVRTISYGLVTRLVLSSCKINNMGTVIRRYFYKVPL